MSDSITTPRAGTTVPAEESTSNGTGTAPSANGASANGNANGTAPGAAVKNGHGAAAPSGGAATAPDTDSVTPRRADQDQEVAAVISGTAKTIQIVLDDANMGKVLAKKGFKKEKLNAGLGLCQAAQNQWEARQTALGHQAACTARVNLLFNEAVKAYGDFRETCRVALKEEASLKALSVTGAVPDDFDQFLTHARGAYHCAKQEPYVTALGESGYDEEGLDEQLEALDVLDKANQEQGTAIADAQKATRVRDEAAAPVREYRNNLRKIARRAFRNEPEQARKLDA